MDTSGVFAPDEMVVTPHHLATQSAINILRNGGTAIEAMVAAAATISVVYPHMNSIGGDSFWLIIPPNGKPIAIEACGQAARQANKKLYKGLTRIPFQGPKSAITVAGTVGGWQMALDYVKELGYNITHSIEDILADAVRYAESGFPVTHSQIFDTEDLVALGEITDDIKNYFTIDGIIPKEGQKICQPKLAETFRELGKNGLNSFYNGVLADKIANDLEKVGSPITGDDLKDFTPTRSEPLHLAFDYGDLYNVGPPTQGLVSLALLGILNKLKISGKDETEFVHTCVEGIKQVFKLRDEFITDPRYMTISGQSLISQKNINRMASNILNKASDLDNGKGPGDTVWMGCMDHYGFSVSFIQSIYHSFGSGVVLPTTGITWHNRGTSFSLDEDSILFLEPGKFPYHTLNPPAAILKDGRVIVYGSEGGDGQPQFQAAVFHRYVVQGMPLQKSVSAPRWIYGRTSGSSYTGVLRIENRFPEKVIKELKQRGHNVVVVDDFSPSMGQAGIVVRHQNGMLEGAYDPRSDGSAAGI